MAYVVDDLLRGKSPLQVIKATEDNPIVKIVYRGIYIKEGKYSGIQIEYGDTPTAYEPYGYKIPVLIGSEENSNTYNIYLNEPLRKIGDYADYIDYKNKKVVRNVKALRLTSDIGWTFATSGGVPYNYCALSDIRKGVEDTMFLCNTYQIEAKNSHHTDKRICYRLNFNGFLIADSAYLNSAAFGAMLDANNIEVVYPIDTVEEAITTEEISTFKDNNVLSINTQIKPNNIKTTYWKQIGVDVAREELTQDGSDILILWTGATITQNGNNLLIGD